jgi:ABC-type phosphate/phosphonate transport system substrate-binding protein
VRIWIIIRAVVPLLAVAFLVGSQAAELAPKPFRIGFSSSMFSDVNENDAKAAVKVWGQVVAKEHGVPTNPDPAIFKDTETMLQSLRNQEVDAVTITTTEYDVLRRAVRFAPVFVAYDARRTAEQYVVLAHHDGPVKSLADLRGRNLVYHMNARVCLASPWLDTLLVQQGFKPAAGFAGKITQNSKLSKVVLPVFFRQTDACLVTRSGFETMSELNPQVGKQLQVIASSAEMVPTVLAFRADFSAPFKEELLAGMRDLHKTPAGQQVLTIFHSEKIEEQPASCLDSALDMLAQYAKLASTGAPDSQQGNGGPQAHKGVNP